MVHFCSVTLIDLSSVNSLSTAAGFLCLKTVATLGIAAIDTNRTLADVGTVAGKVTSFQRSTLVSSSSPGGENSEDAGCHVFEP